MDRIDRMVCSLGELKFSDGGSGKAARKFSGHGAAFGNVDAYGDVIEPGAFSSWLADVKAGRAPWPSMLSQHGGWGMTAEDLTPVGVFEDLAEDGTGLRVDGVLAATPRGDELSTLMTMKPRPAIDGMSIGYIAKEWEPRSKPEDPRRRLKRIDVMEISLVTFPANRKAKVVDVKAIESLSTFREIEEFLCSSGLSKTQAVALLARIKSIGPGDPVGAKGGPGDPAAELDEVLAALRAHA